MITAFVRFLELAVLWILLMRSVQPADLAVGALAAVAATWVSLRLLPPDAGRVKLAALAAHLPSFLWQSVWAGIDVARRALSPDMPLRPGIVTYRTSLPRGQARNAFATITSLLPGTVPIGESEAGISYHCLDTSQAIAEQLAAEEQEYRKALAPRRADG